MPSEITAQDLNKALVEVFGIEPSTLMRREHRAIEKTFNSMSYQNLQKGFNNIAVIRRPDLLIKLLIDEGLLPRHAEIGRKRFCDVSYLTRTALAAPIGYLEENEDLISAWIEDNTEHSSEDVFNVLRSGSCIGASLGYVPVASPAARRLFSRVRALPNAGCRSKVLRCKADMLKLIDAD